MYLKRKVWVCQTTHPGKEFLKRERDPISNVHFEVFRYQSTQVNNFMVFKKKFYWGTFTDTRIIKVSTSNVVMKQITGISSTDITRMGISSAFSWVYFIVILAILAVILLLFRLLSSERGKGAKWYEIVLYEDKVAEICNDTI